MSMKAQVTKGPFFNVLWRNMDSGMYRNVSDNEKQPKRHKKKHPSISLITPRAVILRSPDASYSYFFFTRIFFCFRKKHAQQNKPFPIQSSLPVQLDQNKLSLRVIFFTLFEKPPFARNFFMFTEFTPTSDRKPNQHKRDDV